MCLLPFATWVYERVFSHINYEAAIASLYFYHFQIFLFYTLDCVKITKNLQESTNFLNNTVYSSKLNLEAEISRENVISPP